MEDNNFRKYVQEYHNTRFNTDLVHLKVKYEFTRYPLDIKKKQLKFEK